MFSFIQITFKRFLLLNSVSEVNSFLSYSFLFFLPRQQTKEIDVLSFSNKEMNQWRDEVSKES